MRKLRGLIKKVDASGRFPSGCTAIDVWMLRECYEKLHDGHRYSTVSENVANTCKSCGLSVVEKGIGWTITK